MSPIPALTAAIVAALLCAHPILFYPLSLALFAKRRPLVPQGGFLNGRPNIALLMSAYNEEAVIVSKIERLLSMQELYGPATIHIYVDGASDRTAELLRPFEDRIDLIISAERRGKTYGLNLLVDGSTSDLILFTDANVESDDFALTDLARAFESEEIGCASARLVYTNASESAMSAVGAKYWAIEEALKRIESRTVGLIGVDGAMFMIRRGLYRPAPPQLIDDLYTSLAVLIQRRRVVSVDNVVVRERSAVRSREEYRRKMRIACQAMNVHKALWRDLRSLSALHLYAYVSHRLLKWLTPFFALCSAACFIGACGLAFGWWLVISVVVGGAAALAVADRVGIRIAGLVISVLLSLLGVGIGVLQSLFTRKTYTVWSPAKSVRAQESLH